MPKLGKRLKESHEKIDFSKLYNLEEATELLASLPKTKFDESVDLAVKLGVDPRKAEENVRGTVSLPHGTGKTVRVIAFCKGDKINAAKEAGADEAGADDLVEKIQGGWLDFDVAVATPDCMAQVGKIAKILGPRGLMPNPKVGTVTPDVGKAITAVKAGRVEYRVEKNGIVHVATGRVSFGAAKMKENIETVLDSLVKAKPKSSKGIYFQTLNVSSTMGPGIKIDTAAFK